MPSFENLLLELLLVPVFPAALVAARGVLGIGVPKATAIGQELWLIEAARSAALIGACLLSVLLFSHIALTTLRRTQWPNHSPSPAAPRSPA